MTGPQGMGPLIPGGGVPGFPGGGGPALLEWFDDFDRANGNIDDVDHPWVVTDFTGITSVSSVQINGNKVRLEASRSRARWNLQATGLDQWSQVTVDQTGGSRMGPGVRMNSDDQGYWGSFFPDYAGNLLNYWAIFKQSGNTATQLARGPRITAPSSPITMRLASLDMGSLGTLLVLYHLIGGTPSVVMAAVDYEADTDFDDDSGLDPNLYVGMYGTMDTLHISQAFGFDLWFGGDHEENEDYPAPRVVGGYMIYEPGTSTWQSEFDFSQSMSGKDVLVRGGGSVSGVAYLCVAGGGAGGNVCGGGGGGGGVIYGTTLLSTPQTIVVGAGGVAGGTISSPSTNGGNSQIGSLVTTIGGGKGAGTNAGDAPGAGGSGGGDSAFATATTGGAGTVGQGFKGGDGHASYVGAGGGGAGEVGDDDPGTAGVPPIPGTAHGGDGKQWPIASGGDDLYYGGGGGNGQYSINTSMIPGNGGLGGGGKGGRRHNPNAASVPGTPGTGGGGGGAGHNDGGSPGSPFGSAGGYGTVKFRSQNANWSP